MYSVYVQCILGLKLTIKIMCPVGNLAMSVLHQICTCSSTKSIYLYGQTSIKRSPSAISQVTAQSATKLVETLHPKRGCLTFY